MAVTHTTARRHCGDFIRSVTANTSRTVVLPETCSNYKLSVVDAQCSQVSLVLTAVAEGSGGGKLTTAYGVYSAASMPDC